MRLKPLVAWIMKSQTYQLSATPEPTNADDEANFSHAAVEAAAGRGAAGRDQPGAGRARAVSPRAGVAAGRPASRVRCRAARS